MMEIESLHHNSAGNVGRGRNLPIKRWRVTSLRPLKTYWRCQRRRENYI